VKAPRAGGSRYYTFDLSDGTETVLVIALGEPPCQFGAVTVEGTFERWATMSDSLDAITAQKVICLFREALNRVTGIRVWGTHEHVSVE
jgi:hypothetical protein